MIGRVRRLPRHRPVVVVVVVVRATLPRGPARGIFESDATTTRGGAPANPRCDDMRWSKDFPPTFWNVVRTFDTGRLKRTDFFWGEGETTRGLPPPPPHRTATTSRFDRDDDDDQIDDRRRRQRRPNDEGRTTSTTRRIIGECAPASSSSRFEEG